MSYLKNLTIKARLFAGFFSIAAIALFISAISLYSLSSTTEAFSQFVHGINARGQLAAEVREAVDRRAIAARNLVLVTKESDLELEKAEVTRSHEEVGKRLAQLNEMISDPEYKIGRPRQLFSGSGPRTVKPIGER